MTISPVSNELDHIIQQKIDQKTKPIGSLGQIEKLAWQIARIIKAEPLKLTPIALVFAGDHGIAEQGVSIAPSAVTGLMVKNFIHGGAAINCICAANQIPLKVIDCGIQFPPEPYPDTLINKRIAPNTKDFSLESAMSSEQFELAIRHGKSVAATYIAQGYNVFAIGEMGIGNTSSASAIYAALCNKTAQDTTGYGTGISTEQFHKKIKLIDKALSRIQNQSVSAIAKELGGFEIVQMCGAYLEIALQEKIAVVDGFISSVAALIAIRLDANVRDYLIFSHASEEMAHKDLLKELNATPLLQLGLRLGEGSGAALAIPIIQTAAHIYNQMASFEDLGIEI